ncbi:MAG: elongation factor G [Spirochaetota bacterium]
MSQPLSTDSIRNVVLLGHAGTGKSTLFEALLYAAGKIKKMGSLSDGTLVSDFDDEEKKRKMSIHCAMGVIDIDGVTIHLLDVPGMTDFAGEAHAAVQAAEAAILVVDPVDGVQIGTEKAWQYLNDHNIPRIIFVNKMDKERASYSGIMENLKAHLHAHPVALCMPIGEGPELSGVIDIIDEKALRPKAEGSAETSVSDLPEDMKALVHEQRVRLAETAAEGDDELISLFLEGKDFDESLIHKGIVEQMLANKLHPVIFGSASQCIGIRELLSVIEDCIPSASIRKEVLARDVSAREEKGVIIPITPEAPVCAVVFKTYIDQFSGRMSYIRVVAGGITPDAQLLNTATGHYEKIPRLYKANGRDIFEVPRLRAGEIGILLKLEKTFTGNTLCDPKRPLKIDVIQLPQPVYSLAVRAESRKDDDKLAQILHKFSEQNPTLKYEFNPETHQSVLSGMGELQLEIALEEASARYKIAVKTETPRVAYRETNLAKAEGSYKHKKQSGGHGQYAEVFLRIEPRARGSGFEFTQSIVGGAIPKQYLPGIEKGIREAMDGGVIAQYPVVDVRADVYDGSYHAVDSSELAFKIAGLHAFKDAMAKAKPQLLEPVMDVTVYADKKFMGDILSDITSRRGKVLGVTSRDDASEEGVITVRAVIPQAEMLRYSIDLKSMTSNRAAFEMNFSHYEPISGRIADNVTAARKKMLEEIDKQ